MCLCVYVTEFYFMREKIVLSIYISIYIDPLYLDYFNLVKGISNVMKNRYIRMGLPHVICVSKLKYFVVFFSTFIICNLQLTKTC